MTRHVTVTRTIPAPVDEVFAMISDSDRLASLPSVGVQVLQPGHESRDGVGMRRKVRFAGGLHLVEEVVGLEPPHRFDYFLHRIAPGVRHESGSITFSSVDGGTRVDWSSTFGIPAGRLTPLLEAGAVLASRAGFSLALAQIERALTRGERR
jgi:uncharacterized protein YndB with AHSA1/START domain